MRTLTMAWLAMYGLLPAACVQPAEIGPREEGEADRSAIVGNDARADNTHTAVVSLHDEGNGQCSGTIVGRSADGDKVHVLTAAHCCEESSPPRKVRIGFDYNDPSKEIDVDVGSVEPHPCYNGLEHDVCVVTVVDGGALDVRPIPLASAPDDLAVGSAVTVVGYGTTPATNTIRRRVEARVSAVAPLTIVIDQTNGQGGVCAGDSGGPALIRQGGEEVVVGVLSRASGGLCNRVGVIERVAAFPSLRNEFLDKVLAGQESRIESLVIQRSKSTPGPVRDTYIASDQPDRRSGEDVDLLVGTLPGTDAVRAALLRFDLTAVPRGARLFTARARLSVESRSGPGMISVHRVVRDWDERESWATFGKDGFDPAPAAIFDNARALAWFDVTGLAAEWLGGKTDNHGILLRAGNKQLTQLLSSEIEPRPGLSTRPWMHLCYLHGPP